MKRLLAVFFISSVVALGCDSPKQVVRTMGNEMTLLITMSDKMMALIEMGHDKEALETLSLQEDIIKSLEKKAEHLIFEHKNDLDEKEYIKTIDRYSSVLKLKSALGVAKND